MTMPVYMSLYLFPFSLPYRAKLDLDAHIKVVLEWKDFVPALDQKNVSSSPLPHPPTPYTHMHTQTHTHTHAYTCTHNMHTQTHTRAKTQTYTHTAPCAQDGHSNPRAQDGHSNPRAQDGHSNPRAQDGHSNPDSAVTGWHWSLQQCYSKDMSLATMATTPCCNGCMGRGQT